MSRERAVPEAVLTSTVDQVRIITLNRPEARNAIDSDLSLGVFDALAALDADDDVRVGILTGAGGDFCAGMDLKAFAHSGLPAKIDAILRNGCRKPLIAAIEGVAVGGGLELALIADLLVGSSTARFGSPEVKFGLFPGGGALLRLPRHLPQSLVVELALTGRLISAETAFEHGLLVRLSEPGAASGQRPRAGRRHRRRGTARRGRRQTTPAPHAGPHRGRALGGAGRAGRRRLPFRGRAGGCPRLRREATAPLDRALARLR